MYKQTWRQQQQEWCRDVSMVLFETTSSSSFIVMTAGWKFACIFTATVYLITGSGKLCKFKSHLHILNKKWRHTGMPLQCHFWRKKKALTTTTNIADQTLFIPSNTSLIKQDSLIFPLISDQLCLVSTTFSRQNTNQQYTHNSERCAMHGKHAFLHPCSFLSMACVKRKLWLLPSIKYFWDF